MTQVRLQKYIVFCRIFDLKKSSISALTGNLTCDLGILCDLGQKNIQFTYKSLKYA